MSPYLFNAVKNWANARGGIQVQKAEDWFVNGPVKNDRLSFLSYITLAGQV